MKIEQAKALKVGDWMHLNNDEWVDMVVGGCYKLIKVAGLRVQFVDGAGDVRHCNLAIQHDDFDLPPAATNTQWIPFNKERMSEAEDYRLVRNLRAITEVVLISDTLAWRDDLGEFDCGRVTLELVEMLVPVAVTYPCLCRNAAGFAISLMPEHHAGWTPLTTAELAEIGLKQID